MGGFNTYGEKSKRYGGAYPVWLTVSQKERAGGVLSELPPAGTVIRAGSLVRLENNIATLVETFELANDVTATDTEIKVYAHGCTLRNGMLLMSRSKDDLIVKVNNLTVDTANNIYKFTITANALKELQKGSILLGVTEIGIGEYVYAMPTGLTENDVYVEDGDTAATVASVYHGEILEDRIQPVPDFMKDVLPMIKFVKGL